MLVKAVIWFNLVFKQQTCQGKAHKTQELMLLKQLFQGNQQDVCKDHRLVQDKHLLQWVVIMLLWAAQLVKIVKHRMKDPIQALLKILIARVWLSINITINLLLLIKVLTFTIKVKAQIPNLMLL